MGMREAEVTASTLRSMDQTVVKQLAAQIQSRLEGVDTRLDSGDAATGALDEKLTASIESLSAETQSQLTELQSKTDADFETLRKEAEESHAALTSSVNELSAE